MDARPKAIGPCQGRQLANQGLEQGGLADPIRPHQGDGFLAPDLEVEILGDRRSLIAHRQMLDGEDIFTGILGRQELDTGRLLVLLRLF